MNNRTGEIIEKHRKEKGLTQSELAKKLGVSNTAISKWEHGNNLPDITLLEPLSEILGIDKLLLFTSENEAKEESTDRIKNIKKTNFIKAAILVIVFLLSILFTNYISYKVYQHKLDKLEASHPEIYRFYSKDEEFFVNGYIIFKDDESTIIFEQLVYQDIKKTRTKSKSSNQDITSAELYFDINGITVVKNMITPNKDESKDPNLVLSYLTKSITQTAPINKNSLSNPYLIITLNYNDEIIKNKIELEIQLKI